MNGLAYVSTWTGAAYAGFISEACARTIVGCRAVPTMRTETVDADGRLTSIHSGEQLAESVNSSCKAELIRGPTLQQPRKTAEEVELSTVCWHNHRCLHRYLDDVPPAGFGQSFSADQTDHHQVVEIY
ncbi:hypothetical protein [Sanguibacter antarcticus]|uniref:hypothetical protein n=1 Tax=Sanguibacter antarcticus TaxID=372484 RepID=UPI00117A1777|nr:hypothetical protein [Sanguibacter antarcticus]